MQTYREQLEGSVDNLIRNFISDVSSKFNISKDDLNNMWDKKDNKDNKIVNKEDIGNVDDDMEKYKNMKKNELVKICDELKISKSGKKEELINRIIKKQNRKDNIIDKLNLSLNSIVIKKNEYNNYVHIPTSFVFNRDTKCVIGKEVEEGQIVQLNKNDINICNKYKFKYNIPDDLNNDGNESEDDIDDILEEDSDDDVEGDDVDGDEDIESDDV